ncbi:uncharacterized protein LOC124931833 [Impatiens glandulifera]|uniref:uncharacterized protein LOC124931833 n=1 Tax=Impatiens glandulifera TaxID=253017 RepID=UPI001FB1934C|nr:uncharacterized protein LOC124931833 [Impatiens glandulifera]
MFIQIALALFVGLLSFVYLILLRTPSPRVCGSLNGPPVTSPRVKLKDGRHLAYKEHGVPRKDARYKIVVIHGFDSSKDFCIPVSQEIIEELGIYFLSFDRAGYGESDPNPARGVKSEAFDIEELADKLEIGSKFYVIGVSIGAYPVWSCLKYIPHRLAGASLVVPFVNYWLPSFPDDLLKEAFQILLVQDQWTFRIAHYFPWLFYWWMNQKWFPSLSMMEGNMSIFCSKDLEMLQNIPPLPSDLQAKVRQQGVHESLYRDILAGYGKWEFDILDLSNPFPEGNGSIHIWQGYEDKIIPYKLNRYISQKLTWIKYHEVPDFGHFLIYDGDLSEKILRELLHG